MLLLISETVLKTTIMGMMHLVVEGWNNCPKSERLVTHVGDRNNFHNRALKDCNDLLKKTNQSRQPCIDKAKLKKNEHLTS
jgi:hypothetical protein